MNFYPHECHIFLKQFFFTKKRIFLKSHADKNLDITSQKILPQRGIYTKGTYIGCEAVDEKEIGRGSQEGFWDSGETMM